MGPFGGFGSVWFHPENVQALRNSYRNVTVAETYINGSKTVTLRQRIYTVTLLQRSTTGTLLQRLNTVALLQRSTTGRFCSVSQRVVTRNVYKRGHGTATIRWANS